MPRLALEDAGLLAWQLLLCALIFGYAAQGWNELKIVLGGILAALDGALLLFCAGQGALVFPNRHHFALYAALLLPLAFWDATRAGERHSPARTDFLSLWRVARPLALAVCLLLSLPAFDVWPGILAAWPGAVKLAAQQPLRGWGPGAFDVFYPQFTNEHVPRLPDLMLPGLWARRLAENGALALLGWTLFVLLLASGGIAQRGEHRRLGGALRAGLAWFLFTGVWLSPDGAPALGVTFYALLGLAAALRFGPGIGVGSRAAWPHAPDAPLSPNRPASRALAIFFALAGLSFALWRAPAAWRQTRAHWLHDQSFRLEKPDEQLKMIRAAIEADPDQPSYWIRLARARVRRDGPPASRAAASYLRVALHRAAPRVECPDAALWHEMALLALNVGADGRALWLAQRAARYDPFCGEYRVTLARAWALHGAPEKARREQAIALRFEANKPAHPAARYRRRLTAD